MREATPIKEEALKNTRVLHDRTEALRKMPKGLMVAEVGVAFGDFSREILEIMEPEKFYAIDVFAESTKEFWNDNRFEEANMTHLQYYKKRFQNEIKAGRMEIRQGMSWDALAQFSDATFDYVYLDAAHTYDAVWKDVEALKQKVKEGGIIQFNDYIQYNYKGASCIM